MAVVGIDLGTTYSVIATPEKFTGKYFETIQGITIIKDDYSRRITPSVVALDHKGNILVGHRAKSKAGLKPEPIMFVKRSMGEDKIFHLGNYTLRPEDVSAEILKYLKQMAEEQMNEPVDEAVISVPAYFTDIQKQKTEEAGVKAGIKVGRIIQEPIAAALMYCYNDTRDPLTIMTYDLGGGTFDVAILKKEKGIFKVEAFDGDRNLGGYDFDKRLAYWLIERLKKHNYKFPEDLNSPEHRLLLSKLLVLAEQAKCKLSDMDNYTLIDQNPNITDREGEPISINIEMNKEVFEDLIKDYIEDTIRICKRAMNEKTDPPVSPDQIDEIVMVGGSSRIPLITRMLKEEFGKEPKLIDPDLCVAIGAAMMAGRLGQKIGAVKLDFIPPVTTLSTIQITGIIEQGEDNKVSKEYTVKLIPADGSMPLPGKIKDQGGFIFPVVPLAADTVNTFILKVCNPKNEEIVSHEISIRRDADAENIQTLAGFETNLLTKPISIMTVHGLYIAAPEKTPLPHTCFITAETEDQSGEIHIPIYEGNNRLGEIFIDSVPETLPVGSKVEITLNLRSDFYIDGRAYIPSKKIEVRAKIDLPPVLVKTLAELQNDFIELSAKANEALGQTDRGLAFALVPKIKSALNAVRKLLFEEKDPNLSKAQELLEEVELLIRELQTWSPEPPPDHYKQILEEIENELLPELTSLKTKDIGLGYESQVKAITRQCEKALAERNETMWMDGNRQLTDLRNRILSAIQEEKQKRKKESGRGNEDESLDPRKIKIKLGLDLIQLQETAKKYNRYKEFAHDFDDCKKELDSIDPRKDRAMDFLIDYYENKHQPLQAKVMASTPAKSTLPYGLLRILKKDISGKG